jgi:exonuclease III
VGADLDISITKEYKDVHENYYVMCITLKGVAYGIGSVYGPNQTSREFFRNLSSVIRDIYNSGIDNIIIGGDWNTTWDRRPIISNIDTFHMAALPNPKNSELLEELCAEFGLVDPYRVLFPFKKDFTYIPFGTVRLNRSRLDFFIMSGNLIKELSDCSIASTVSCKQFDHKSVTLALYAPSLRRTGNAGLNNSFLDNQLLIHSIELACRKCHIVSLNTECRDILDVYGTYEDIRGAELEKIG